MPKRMGYINASALSLAILLLGYATATVPRAVLLQSAEGMVAAVGMSLSVAPNPYNATAEQLANKQKQLDQREAQVALQEHAPNTMRQLMADNQLGLYSLGMSVFLFILVAVNFYLDMRRRARPLEAQNFSIDLR